MMGYQWDQKTGYQYGASYAVATTGAVSVSTDGVIEIDRFELAEYYMAVGPNQTCVTLYYNAIGSGTTTVTATYYYKYSNSTQWYKATSTFTVKVTASSATYTLAYNSNGGTGSMTSTTATNTNGYANLTAKSNTFTAPSGYVFDGWNTSADGTGTSYAAGASVYVTGTTTLYAQWALDSDGDGTADKYETYYTVTYTDGVEDATVFADQSITVEAGSNTPSFTGSTDRKNYIFVGWSPSVSNTVQDNATYAATWAEDFNNNGIADSSETKYTVTYMVDGEESTTIKDTNTYLSGTDATVVSGVPTKEGSVFAGWSYGDDIYYSGNTIEMPSANIQLVAQWEDDTTTDDDDEDDDDDDDDTAVADDEDDDDDDTTVADDEDDDDDDTTTTDDDDEDDDDTTVADDEDDDDDDTTSTDDDDTTTDDDDDDTTTDDDDDTTTDDDDDDTTTTTTTTTVTTVDVVDTTVIEDTVVPATAATTAATTTTTAADPEEDDAEEAAAESATEIEADEVPLAAAEEAAAATEIEEEEVPLVASAATTSWALVNLILAIATAATSIVMLAGYFLNRRDEEEGNGKGSVTRLLSLLPALLGVVCFALTENMANNMAFVDKWTLAMVLITLIQVAVVIKVRKDEGEQEDSTFA